MRKKTVRNLALAATGAAVLIAAPAALAQVAAAPAPAGATVTSVSNGAPPQATFQAATYPAFADDRPAAAPYAVDADSALGLGASPQAGLPVASGNLPPSRLDDLLAARLAALPNDGAAYIKGDAGAYAKRLYEANGGNFSVSGDAPEVSRSAPAGSLAYGVSGAFTLTNTRSVANALKDPDGNVLAASVAPGASVTYSFESSQTPGIVALAEPGDDGSVTVSWAAAKLYVSVSGAGLQPTRWVRDNVVFAPDSGVSITISGAVPGVDPYAAKAGLVGAGKKFSASLITPRRVADDAQRLFTDAFAATKTGLSMLSSLLADAVSRRGTDYAVADLISDNAGAIADFAVAAVPELAQSDASGAPPVAGLIKALLGSYSKSATRETLYDAVYEYRDTIVALIASSLSAYPSYAQAARAFLSDVSSGSDLFTKISQLNGQIRGFLSGTSAEPLLKLVTALSASKDVYALDLLTDPGVAGSLLDVFLSAPAGDAAPGLAKFVKSYRAFFLDLLTRADNPVDGFVVGMFGNGGGMFRDLLNVLSSSVEQAAPQVGSLLDAFIYQNPTFQDDKKLLDAAYKLFAETAALFSKDNLAKVTMQPLQSDPAANMSVENTDDGKDVRVYDLNVGYRISAAGFTVRNGFVDALLGFFPAEPLAQTLDRFVQPEMDNARAQAQTAIQAELSKLWYAWILPGDAAHNIAYGPSWDPSSGVVDLIVALTKQGMAGDATLQALAKEIAFGTARSDSAPGFAAMPFATISGSVVVNYSATRAYALPYYTRDLSGAVVMDYQLLGAQIQIDPTDLAKNSKFFQSSSTLTGADAPVISAFGLSQALQKGVRGLAQGFLDHTVGRAYAYSTRLVLTPDAQAAKGFALDPSKPDERIAVGAAAPGYAASVAPAFTDANRDATVKAKVAPGWLYFGNQPQLTDGAYAAIDASVSLSDQLQKDYGKYVTSSTALYGSGQSQFKATFSAKVFVGTIFNIWQWVNAEVTFNYDIRIADHSVYLPWAVALTDGAGNTYLGDTLTVSMTDFEFNYSTLWWL